MAWRLRPRGSDQDRARRRFARRQWARRWLTWRYVLAGVLTLAVIGFGIYAVYFSAWLRTEGVEVEGVSQLTTQQVLRAADVPTGGPLLRVDLAAIEKRVRNTLPAVKSVDVSRVWPHDIRITVQERTPVATVETGTTVLLVDADGHHFPRTKRSPTGLPRIILGANADDEALAEAAAVVASLDPSVASLVDHVEVASMDQIVLRLDDDRIVRWGSAEQSEDKAAVLLALLGRDARVYDVSVPGLPTTS